LGSTSDEAHVKGRESLLYCIMRKIKQRLSVQRSRSDFDTHTIHLHAKNDYSLHHAILYVGNRQKLFYLYW